MTSITVVDVNTGEELRGIPTPRLIQQGSGEAYFIPNPNVATSMVPGIWYLKDVADGYASPTGEYRRVRIVITESYQPWT